MNSGHRLPRPARAEIVLDQARFRAVDTPFEIHLRVETHKVRRAAGVEVIEVFTRQAAAFARRMTQVASTGQCARWGTRQRGGGGGGKPSRQNSYFVE